MHNTSNKKNSPHLSVIIPAYNEEARIGETLEIVIDYLCKQSYQSELLVVDDGSTDRTLEICNSYAKKYPSLKTIHYVENHGKGYAVRKGILAAEGKYILFSDADLATPIDELDGFWKHLDEGADIVIASRPLKESHLVKRQPFYREFAGRAFNKLVQMLAVPGIYDTQCGFKLFKRNSARTIFPLCQLNGFSFDIEALHVAQKLGFCIHEVGVHWYHKEGSKVSMIRDGMKMLSDLMEIRRIHRSLPKHSGRACDES